MSKKPHLNPINNRRKSALELLKKNLSRKGRNVFIPDQGAIFFVEYTDKDIKRIEQEIQTLEKRIVR